MNQSYKRSKKWSIRGLLDLIETLPSEIAGIEIGSFAGESARLFVDSGKFTRLYCVDPWEGLDPRDEAEKRFDETCGDDPRIIKCKGTLRDFRRTLPDVDFIYIDADHSYRAVLRDIGQAMMFLKPGGIMAGHDYADYFKGTMKAVNNFYEGRVRVFKDSSWMVVK